MFKVKDGILVGNTVVIDSAGQMDFSRLKNKPTTLAGYGITDALSGLTASNVSDAGGFIQQTDLGAGVDLNTVIATGWYNQNTNANTTSTGAANYPVNLAGKLEVQADGMMVYQTYHVYNGTGMYQRSYHNGTWYAWRRMWDAGSLTNLNQLTNGPGFITATDNAATATKLATARSINGVAFDGSADITIAAAFDGNLSSNLTFGGASRRILGDFSNTTHSSRTLFQTSVANGNTSIGSMPNGTGGDGRFTAYAASDPNNSVTMVMGSDSSSGYIASEQRGTGVYRPLNMWTNGALGLSISTDGIVRAHRSEMQAENRATGGSFRATSGTSPAAIIRNDGTNTYVLFTNNNDAQGTWNSLRPLAIHNTTGQVTGQHGFIQNRGFGVVNFQTIGDIGGSFVDWNNTRWPALQVDAGNSQSAYMIWRATRWSGRHIAAMDAYEGGSDSTNCYTVIHVGSTQNAFTFEQGGNFTAVGNVAAFSDERLKKNWRPVASDFVAQLAQVKSGVYDRIDTEETQVGVGAQSLQAVLPEAVVNDPNRDRLTVAYGNAALVATIELAKELMALKAEIVELKAQLAAKG